MATAGGNHPMSNKDALQRLVDGLQALIRDHLALARVELKQDARELGKDLAMRASGVPALLTGYMMLMAALGFLLAVWLPTWAGFGIVALVNLAAGAFLTAVWGPRAIQRRLELRTTTDELRRDKQWLSQLTQTSAPPPAQPLIPL